jgi:hypothetical protein
MNDFEKSTHLADSGYQMDLLVDGELSEADRRTLLLRLDHEPDGWRRCALAFLEAQCWRAELGQLPTAAAIAPAEAKPAVQAEPTRRWQTWRQHTATLLTMAASFLLALVLGMGLRSNMSGSSSHSPDTSITRSAVSEFPLANRDAGHSPLATAVSSDPAMPGKPPAGDWEMVTLDGKSAAGQTGTYRVPAVHRDALDQEMLKCIPDAIPPEVQQAFEQSGHRVVQQREIVPLQMKDGRRLVVPVDHVEIHYVGRPSL